MKKLISIFVLLASLTAIAADMKTSSNKLIHGIRGSTGDKTIEIDTNNGASNPKIKITNADKNWHLMTNKVKIGDATASNKTLEWDIGAGSANPNFRWNNSTSKIQLSTDGTTYYDISTSAGASVTISQEVATGHHGLIGTVDCDWSFSNGSPVADPSPDASCTFTADSNSSGFTALAAVLSSGDDLPGVQFVPTASGRWYEVCATVMGYNGTNGQFGVLTLNIDGSTTGYPRLTIYGNGTSEAGRPWMQCAQYLSTGTSAVTAKIQGYTSAGSTFFYNASGLEPVIYWSVKRASIQVQ